MPNAVLGVPIHRTVQIGCRSENQWVAVNLYNLWWLFFIFFFGSTTQYQHACQSEYILHNGTFRVLKMQCRYCLIIFLLPKEVSGFLSKESLWGTPHFSRGQVAYKFALKFPIRHAHKWTSSFSKLRMCCCYIWLAICYNRDSAAAIIVFVMSTRWSKFCFIEEWGCSVDSNSANTAFSLICCYCLYRELRFIYVLFILKLTICCMTIAYQNWKVIKLSIFFSVAKVLTWNSACWGILTLYLCHWFLDWMMWRTEKLKVVRKKFILLEKNY